ncbi:MAG: HAMP domain-containing histidine kinase, partial [Bacteroidetes bacterium]|nr:HAMP domain-containing histidine kinase [Bacteroidota bacterium]
VGTVADITEQKKAEKEIKETNEALQRINNDLDNFIYTASHDLRSPVLNLEGLVELFKKSLEEKISEKDQHLLKMMESSIVRLKTTILDLAEITKAQKGSNELPKKLSFKAIIEEVKEDLSSNLKFPLPPFSEALQVARLRYRKKDLRSILYNLLSNAIKFKSPLRPLAVEIRTYQENGSVVLSVKDNGIGLSKEQIPKLFHMFKRLHNHVEGTGIGLYIVKRILENSGGRIEVESEVGKGAVFTLYLRDQAIHEK